MKSVGRQLALLLVLAVAANGCATRTVDPRVIEDAQTAVRVKTALVNDAQIGTRLIEVRVHRGIARLSGYVASAEEAERAVTLARGVPGVVKVESELAIRPGAPPPSAQVESPLLPQPSSIQPPRDRTWLALGVSINPQFTSERELSSSWSIYPLIRLGSRRGLAAALGFTWFSADLTSAGGSSNLGRLKLKPVMGGIGHTSRRGRTAATVSIVGGYSFNRFTLTAVTAGDPVPVSVKNSFVTRPGLSLWYDANSRIAVNLSAAYVITRPRLDLLRGGRTETVTLRADTAIVGVGLAYRLF